MFVLQDINTAKHSRHKIYLNIIAQSVVVQAGLDSVLYQLAHTSHAILAEIGKNQHDLILNPA